MRRGTVGPTLLATAIMLGAAPAWAEQGTVAPSRVAEVLIPVEPSQLAPPACDGLALETLVIATVAPGGGGGGGGGRGGAGSPAVVQGTNGNDLILGTAGSDVLNGRLGDDCLVGGAGDDDLRGGQGTDACSTGGEMGDTTVDCEVVA